MDADGAVPRRPRRRSLPLEGDDETTEAGRRGLNAYSRLLDLRNKGLKTPYAQEIVDEGRYNIGRAWDELNRQYETRSGGHSSSRSESQAGTHPGGEAVAVASTSSAGTTGRQRRNSFDTISGDLSMGGVTWGTQPQQPQQWQQQNRPQQNRCLWQQQQAWHQQQQQQQHSTMQGEETQQHAYHQNPFGGELEGSPTQQGTFFASHKRKHREVDDGYGFTSPQRIKQRRNSNSFSQLSPLFQREQTQVQSIEGFLPLTFGMRGGGNFHSPSSMQN